MLLDAMTAVQSGMNAVTKGSPPVLRNKTSPSSVRVNANGLSTLSSE